MRGKLPLDVELQKIGIVLGSKCKCCEKGNIERINHFFVKSAKAQVVWNYFEVKMGIACRSNVLKIK